MLWFLLAARVVAEGESHALARETCWLTPSLSVQVEANDQIGGLTNRLTGVNWLPLPSGPLFSLSAGEGLKTSLQWACITNTGEVKLTLVITNSTDHSNTVAPTFPQLEGLDPGGNYADFRECFPEMGRVSDAKNGRFKRYYGGDFPLQFMDVYAGKAGGIYVMTHDLTDSARAYELDKTPTNATFRVSYSPQTIPPGGSWTLTAVIGGHAGDWHDALAAYRNWVATWYSPIAPRKPWFQDVYNFRQVFLHTNASIGALPAYNPISREYSLASLIARDSAAFGGIDYVHLFDWAQTPESGRVGDYQPWSYLGGPTEFSNQVATIQGSGIPLGLYFEGYLVSTQAEVGRRNGQAWQLLNARGKPYASMGRNSYYMDPEQPNWADYLTGKCLLAASDTGAMGIYLDEFGFGWQYPCYNPRHPHSLPSQQVKAEGSLMRKIRLALPSSKVLYSEERNTDVNSQYQDGSFTYSISQSASAWNPSHVDLARFALPDFKVFEIIRVDAPLGNDPSAVLSVFFNGEGIWLEGPVNDRWFPDNVCRVIAHTHSILRQYADAFRSANPMPLVETLNPNVYANQFSAPDRTVWTFYNAGNEPVKGEVLRTLWRSGQSFYDAWNDRPLLPRVSGNNASVSLNLLPGGAGCVVEQREKSSGVSAAPAAASLLPSL